MNANKQQTESNKTVRRLGWNGLVLSLACQASGFQSSAPLHVVPGFAETLPSRRASTGVYGDGENRALARTSTLSATRLQYSSDDSSSSGSRMKWLSIFPTARSEEPTEQDTVDEYLEFLDRRYHRLHDDEKDDSPAPFSALNWLKQGSQSTRANEEDVISQQQQEDALYVLGVAGLASQKLLQKHHLVQEDSVETQRTATATKLRDETMIVDADIVPTGPAAPVIKSVILPLIRVLYIVQRRKDLFVNQQLERAKSLAVPTLKSICRTVVRGPGAMARAFLDMGGTKRSLALTAAILGTLLVLLKPVLQAALKDGGLSA